MDFINNSMYEFGFQKFARPSEIIDEIYTNNLEIVHLKQSRNELENLLQQPINLYIARKRIKDMDIVHCRMPDYTGILGVILSIKALIDFISK